MMDNSQSLIIEKTVKTPQIDLNQLTGELMFSGRSIPENAAKVYEPALNWITEYAQNARSTTNLHLNLEYFNTASSIWLTKIIKVLVHIKNPDYVLIIHLYVDIDDYDEINEFGDIKDAFLPIADISDAIPSIGLKLYGIDDDGEVIKDTIVFI